MQLIQGYQILKPRHLDQIVNSNPKVQLMYKMEEKRREGSNLQVIKKDNNYQIN